MYRSGVFIGNPTLGKSSPGKNSRQGCLCRDRDAYSIKCCDKTLMAQGIGQTSKSPSE